MTNCISKVIVGANFDVNAPKYQELFKAVNTYEDLTIHKCMLSSEKYQIELKSIYDSSMYSYFIVHGKKVMIRLKATLHKNLYLNCS